MMSNLRAAQAFTDQRRAAATRRQLTVRYGDRIPGAGHQSPIFRLSTARRASAD